MDKKRILQLLSLILAASCLTGCDKPEASGKKQVQTELVRITEEVHTGGNTLLIETAVEVPALTALEEITLCFDDDLLDTMVEELVHNQYPGLEEHPMDGDRRWIVSTEEQLLFSFGITEDSWEAGRTHYLDVLRDLNGQHVDDDERDLFTPYYMTKHIPDQLELSPEEAASTMGDFLTRYSCFSYKPWNVAAVNCRNQPGTSGYYQMRMQPQFDGLPVYGHGALQVSACMSADGIFTFQGIMVLKEQSRKIAEVNMTLEKAVEQFKIDFAEDPQGELVTVDQIKVGYLAESHYSGTWSLCPVWVFEYHVINPRTDSQGDYTYYDTCAYRMKNGSLHTFS